MLRSSWARKTICLLILFFTAAAALYASGQGEDQLKAAQDLMAAKEYEKALGILNVIARESPDRFAEAQVYIDICMRHQDEVNSLWEKIVESLKEKNTDSALDEMERLKAVDPKKLDVLLELYEGYRLARAFNDFQKVMDAAYQQTLAGKYREALDTYKQGFAFYREDFFANAGYAKVIVPNVQNTFIEYETLVVEYYSKSALAEKSQQEVADLFADGRPAEGLARSESAYKDYIAFLNLRQRFIRIGRRFIEQNDSIKKTSQDRKPDTFLRFAQQVLLGRDPLPGNPVREGVYYVIERHWETLADKTAALFKANSERAYSLAQENERQKNPAAAEANYAQAERFSDGGTKYLRPYLTTAGFNAPRTLDARDRQYLKEKYPLYSLIAERGIESKKYRALLDLQKQYDAISRRPSEDEALFNKTREEVRANIDILTGHTRSLQKRQDEVARFAGRGYEMTETARSLPEVISRFGALLASYQKLDIGYTALIAERERKPILDAHREREKDYVQAGLLRDGDPGAPEAERNRRYPSKALKMYETLKTDLDKDKAAIKKFLEDWDKPYLAKDPVIKSYLDEVKDVQAKNIALKKNTETAADKARDNSEEADDYFKRGREEYNEALSYLKASEFDKATERADLAEKDIKASVSYEYDKTRQEYLDITLPKLRAEINKNSLDARITEITQRLERGIEQFNYQDFNGAKVSLERAKKLVNELPRQQEEVVTSLRSDISLWLDLVNKALDIELKRVINEKDPLYADVTARLKQANASYQAGLAFKKKGEDAAADQSFQDAKALIKTIQQQFPHLKDSGELFLNIMKAEKGEAQYRLYIDEQVRSIRRGLATMNNADLRQAESDVENLLGLDPSNAVIKALLVDIKNRLYKKPEVSRENQGQSDILFGQANRIYRAAKRTRDELKRAFSYATEAIKLNPLNKPARDLRAELARLLSIPQ